MNATVTPINWRVAAACADDPDLFFSEDPQDEAKAKAVCAQCPVRRPCLQDGLGAGHGVWGGLNPEERGHHARRLRDRARKAAERENAA